MKRVLMLLLILPFFIGCASGYTRVIKAPEKSMKTYDTLVIRDFTGGDQVPTEVKKGIPDLIAKQSQEFKLFSNIERGDAKPSGNVLVLQGQVIQYNPGSRGMRYLTGPIFGAGRGSVIVNVKFLELESGKCCAESNFEGEIKGGLFGGGIDETHEKIAEEIIQYIRTNK